MRNADQLIGNDPELARAPVEILDPHSWRPVAVVRNGELVVAVDAGAAVLQGLTDPRGVPLIELEEMRPPEQVGSIAAEQAVSVADDEADLPEPDGADWRGNRRRAGRGGNRRATRLGARAAAGYLQNPQANAAALAAELDTYDAVGGTVSPQPPARPQQSSGRVLARSWQTATTEDYGLLNLDAPDTHQPRHAQTDKPDAITVEQILEREPQIAAAAAVRPRRLGRSDTVAETSPPSETSAAIEHKPTTPETDRLTLRERCRRHLGRLSVSLSGSKLAAGKRIAEFAFDTSIGDDQKPEAKLTARAKVVLFGLAAIKAYGLSRGINTSGLGASLTDIFGAATPDAMPEFDTTEVAPETMSPNETLIPPADEAPQPPTDPAVEPLPQAMIGAAGSDTDTVWELIMKRNGGDPQAAAAELEAARSLNDFDLDHVVPGQEINLPVAQAEVESALPGDAVSPELQAPPLQTAEQLYASDILVGQGEAGPRTASEVVLGQLNKLEIETTLDELDVLIRASVSHDAAVHHSLGMPAHDVYSMPEGYRFYAMPAEAIEDHLRQLRAPDDDSITSH